MSGKSWYDTGYEVLNKKASQLVGGEPRRLWIPPEKSCDVVFVDDAPFTINEHNCKINGSWKNWNTCLRGVFEDVVCCEILGWQSRSQVSYYTAVNCQEWTDKKGNKHQYEIELFGAKQKTLKKLKRKHDEKGHLLGSLYTSTREDSKSPGVGDEFEYKREVDMDKLFQVAMFNGKKLTELWAKAAENAEVMEQLKKVFQVQFDDKGKLLPKIVPFNYMEVLAPKDPKDLKVILKGVEVEEKGDDAAPKAGTAEEEVPF